MKFTSQEFEVGDVFRQVDDANKLYIRSSDGWHVFRTDDNHTRLMRYVNDAIMLDYFDRGTIALMVDWS